MNKKNKIGSNVPYQYKVPPMPRVKPPANSIADPLEEQEQIWLFEWAELNYGSYPSLKKMYHIPNEGKRSAVGGHRLVMQGLKSGVPDICLPVARKGYHSLYIELKRMHGGTLSQNQKDWRQDLLDEGHAVETCNGWHKAAQVLMAYLGGVN